MEKQIYRFVPLRFVVSEPSADVCRLEKLTNLFPDLKEIIELELFKLNNLEHMVERLSKIYTPSSALDTRDDTLHLFLGPYHLSVGPATAGAMRFKNVSKALLASSQAKTSKESLKQYQKRRHDVALRRFRRAVRKLIQIKSMIGKLRLASILTPYNQYQLHARGIDDLVLSGYIHSSKSVFTDVEFLEQIDDFHFMKEVDEHNPLIVSKFVKINTLLHLLAPHPHASEQNSTPGKIPQIKSDDGSIVPTGENSSSSLFHSLSICCSHHSQNIPLVRLPISRSVSQQSMHLYESDSRARRTSRFDECRKSSIFPESDVTNSLPDLVPNYTFNVIPPSTSPTSQPEELTTLVPVQIHVPDKREDAFVDRISILLTNYVLSQQSTATPSTDSPTIDTNDFDKLLQRIRTTVDHNLSHDPLQTTNNLSKKVSISSAVSSDDSPTDEQDVQHLKPSFYKRELFALSKSRSFDETNLKFHTPIHESNDNFAES